jgi:kumamolisin
MASSYAELPGSKRPLREGARRLHDIDPQAHVEVTVTLRGGEKAGAEDVLQPAMTAEEAAKHFGAAPEDIQKVEKVLREYGLTVQGVSAGGASLRVSGTAAAIQEAFQTHLGIYQHAEQGEYRGREGTLMVPSEIAGIVTGVFGLDQRQVARRHSSAAARPAGFGLSIAGFEAHYNFPAGDGSGQVIAVAEFGTPVEPGFVLTPAYIPADLTAFCKSQNVPEPTVQIVSVNLAPLTEQQLQAQVQQNPQLAEPLFVSTAEVMMDVEIVAGFCPKAKILVYFATFDQKGWIDLLDKINSASPATPVCLSISYSLAEDSTDWSASALQEINKRLHAAAAQGITVCVSSGDDGTGAQMKGSRAHVGFPSSSPFVLSVGGTMLNGAAEVVWWESPGRRTKKGGGATGGGVSVEFARPSWQTVSVASLNPGSMDGRIVPDIAALAGPPGYAMILMGKLLPRGGGGTSASTPLWAALIARITAALPAAKRQRFLAPLLYQNGAGGTPRGKTGCRDITSGQNASNPNPGKGYSATPGFDAVTGWGVPDGKALLAALSK